MHHDHLRTLEVAYAVVDALVLLAGTAGLINSERRTDLDDGAHDELVMRSLALLWWGLGAAAIGALCLAILHTAR